MSFGRRLKCCFAVLIVLHIKTVSCFSPGTPLQIQRSDSRWTMYMPPSSPTTQTPPMVAQSMAGTELETGSSMRLSRSVLASCNTLPSFQTAHGILSPETVLRMDEMTGGGHGNPTVTKFLSTYRRKGPMSCLEMLSDPEVLPHLTKAMRDVV